MEQRLATAVDTAEPLIGSWGFIPHPSTAELAASVGYDFVVVDAEHSPMSDETVAEMLRGIDAADGDAETMVRVADDDPTTLQRTLDLGPDAILVPMVDTPKQAERIVRAARYPPSGSRGIGPARSTGYSLSLAEAVEANDDAFGLHVQLESEQAIDNAAEIAAVDGVDGVFVGPMDLSLSMGGLGEYDTDRFQTAVDRALTAAREEAVAVGTLATDATEREQRLAWGVDYLVAGVDLLHVADGAKEALAHSRDLVGDE
ncbi:4-hydroxy-2-oxoheptanedioate aldolase [Halalkaliarchaeum desulfuricum]|uniref:4-hydroxy-2-oxoheptanedioate aldolase n=1 Tax=Halalkaliarchaeum desulfuricum TaxID=2055893 RepID=A0A343TMJ5_9EURY|nr:aldolase/citrate lyase family protein [Halalkaliarchaeum desulfuricum]AUX10317.1 4-hydroxy-2-oxoheptanedioate aldolase [Halalkaliarchaeum desulfuricum]